MLMDLRRQNFDVGVAGCGLADSMLFRHMELPYVKVCEHDIEAYHLQMLNIPLLTSIGPSLQQGTADTSFSYRIGNWFNYVQNYFVF